MILELKFQSIKQNRKCNLNVYWKDDQGNSSPEAGRQNLKLTPYEKPIKFTLKQLPSNSNKLTFWFKTGGSYELSHCYPKKNDVWFKTIPIDVRI